MATIVPRTMRVLLQEEEVVFVEAPLIWGPDVVDADVVRIATDALRALREKGYTVYIQRREEHSAKILDVLSVFLGMPNIHVVTRPIYGPDVLHSSAFPELSFNRSDA